MDGTLLDSMWVWKNSGSNYLKMRGKTPESGLDEKFKTFSILEVAEYFRREYGLTESVEWLAEDLNSSILHWYQTKVTLKPGVLDFLEEHKEKKMCIATATDRSLVEVALNATGISSYFSKIFTCTEVGAGKKFPDIYRAALAHLGTKKEETWVFEDAYHGVFTAKQDGFPVVGVADPSAEGERLQIQELSDIFVENFSELPQYPWGK